MNANAQDTPRSIELGKTAMNIAGQRFALPVCKARPGLWLSMGLPVRLRPLRVAHYRCASTQREAGTGNGVFRMRARVALRTEGCRARVSATALARGMGALSLAVVSRCRAWAHREDCRRVRAVTAAPGLRLDRPARERGRTCAPELESLRLAIGVARLLGASVRARAIS